jgi:hypothetical protein
MPIRVLLADDPALVRQGLRVLLEREGFQVAGEACDGQDVVRPTLGDDEGAAKRSTIDQSPIGPECHTARCEQPRHRSPVVSSTSPVLV